MNKNWQIPRRKFLRGLGTIIALPMLDVMLPPVSAFAAAAGGTPQGFPKRLAFVYVPQGKNMEDWTPTAFGENYDRPATDKMVKELKGNPKFSGLVLDVVNSVPFQMQRGEGERLAEK